MLSRPFFGDPTGSYSGGKVKDRLPPYKSGGCSSFNDTVEDAYAQMGWKGPYYRIQGKKIDNGIIPEYDITFQDFVDDWGNPLQVPFDGDSLKSDYAAVFDPNFGNGTSGNDAYNASYSLYSGILISGGPNSFLNSAMDTDTYLDPYGIESNNQYDNDDIFAFINKNEIMANFASSGNVSNALDSGENIQVNTGLNIWFQFQNDPGLSGVTYTVEEMAMIYPDQAQAYGFKVRMFPKINHSIDTVVDDNINKGLQKDDLQRGSIMSAEQVYVPVGTTHVYALIRATNLSKTGKPYFEQGCEASIDDPEWALSLQSRWGDKLAKNMEETNKQISYGIFYAPLEINSGSGSYTVTIPVNVATVLPS
jgi:hypothetical protein